MLESGKGESGAGRDVSYEVNFSCHVIISMSPMFEIFNFFFVIIRVNCGFV